MIKTQKFIRRAVEIVGSQQRLAEACGVRQQHVWDWMHRDKRLPAERAIQIERATAGRVTLHQLRPDLYPDEPGSQTN